MSKLVIVAIPAQDEYVWEVSSEKVPHITLVFLGDPDTVENTDEIVAYVEHAATTISPFYMDVDYRGELGADKADVIFFEKGWDFKAVSTFRDQLLANTFIKKAYNSTEQFPEWTPHLTLGYPSTPAKVPDTPRHIHAVCFDRIGIWFGDFDGPEFRLERKAYDSTGVQMTSMTRAQADELLHFGIKGMKWGVVKAKLVSGSKAVGRGLGVATVAIADSHWRGSVYSEEKAVVVHNAVSERLNGEHGAIARLNSSPKYRGKNLEADAKLKVEYHQDFAKVTDRAHRLAVNDIHGKNYSGTQKAVYVNDVNGSRIEITNIDAKHAVDEMVVIRLLKDSHGQIIEANKAESNPVIIQGEEFVEGLFHYGVKGMKWGKRMSTTPVAETKVKVETGHTKKGKAVIETSGGTKQPAHKDAIDARILGQKLKKSGTVALSNKELRDLATRIDLEKRIDTLTTKPEHPAKKFVRDLLGVTAKQQTQRVVNFQATKQVDKMLKAKTA